MKPDLNQTMAEATRLVGLGDLRRATAIIQQGLGNPAGFPGGAVDFPLAGQRVESAQGAVLDGIFERIADWPPSTTPNPAAPAGDPAGTNSGDAARFTTLTHRNAAGSRSYKLYVPAGDPARPRPLIVMLHGCTQGPDDFAAGTRMNQLADEHGFIVAYPAQAQSANSTKCWNWFQPGDQQRDRGEPSLIAGIARDVAGACAVDPARVHLAGFSAGAAMAVIVAAAYPDLYAAVGIHSGLGLGVAHDIPSALAAMRAGGAGSGPLPRRRPATGASGLRVPAIIFHGDRDTTVHPRNGEQIIGQWGEPAGEAAIGPEVPAESGQAPGGRPYTRRILRGTAERPLLEHWRLHGAGHGWSGGSIAGTYTDPRGPDAAREMVRFFAQNPRDVSASTRAPGT